MKIKERIDQLSYELSGDSGALEQHVKNDLRDLAYEIVRWTAEYYETNLRSPGDTVFEVFAFVMEQEFAPPGAVLEVEYDQKTRKTKVTLRRTWACVAKARKKGK